MTGEDRALKVWQDGFVITEDACENGFAFFEFVNQVDPHLFFDGAGHVAGCAQFAKGVNLGGRGRWLAGVVRGGGHGWQKNNARAIGFD